MSNWKAGDKAVCIDVSPNEYYDVLPPLTKETIYLVDRPDDQFCPGELGLYLSGVQHHFDEVFGLVPFAAKRFRKLVPLCDRADVGQGVAIPTPVLHRFLDRILRESP